MVFMANYTVAKLHSLMKHRLYLGHCVCYNLWNSGDLSLFNCASSVTQTTGLSVICEYFTQCGQLYYLSIVVLILQEESEVVGRDNCGPWNCMCFSRESSRLTGDSHMTVLVLSTHHRTSIVAFPYLSVFFHALEISKFWESGTIKAEIVEPQTEILGSDWSFDIVRVYVCVPLLRAGTVLGAGSTTMNIHKIGVILPLRNFL